MVADGIRGIEAISVRGTAQTSRQQVRRLDMSQTLLTKLSLFEMCDFIQLHLFDGPMIPAFCCRFGLTAVQYTKGQRVEAMD